jgi:exodeoxyribonuclease VII small subunit
MSESRRQKTEKKPPRTIDLEKALSELEEIVAQLEAGDLPLEKSLRQFERGVRLSRECQVALKNAEQKVQILMEAELKDFEPEGDSDDVETSAEDHTS